jgi:hypothetical protein
MVEWNKWQWRAVCVEAEWVRLGYEWFDGGSLLGATAVLQYYLRLGTPQLPPKQLPAAQPNANRPIAAK